MALMLNTNIDHEVQEKITGFIARAGGSVNQLVDYRRCIVEDINILDGGFGKVDKISSFLGMVKSGKTLARYLKQELKFIKNRYRVSRDRKTVLQDMHFAHQQINLMTRYDNSISSNMIEHSTNPIWLLLNFCYITKLDGYQFHAIPHYKYTYDKYRTPTELAHFITDFENMTNADDASHIDDYYESAVVKDGWQKSFHQKYPLTYPFIHQHVLDEFNTKELLELMFEEVTSDVLVDGNFSDNVVLFKNKLKTDFIYEYADLIKAYSIDIYSALIQQSVPSLGESSAI